MERKILSETVSSSRPASKSWGKIVLLWCIFISTDTKGIIDLDQVWNFTPRLLISWERLISLSQDIPAFVSPVLALLTVAFSDRYQSGIGMWWFGTFLLLFFWSSDSQSREFRSGKLLLMSMPSWVHRPRDQPPNSEPLDLKKKERKRKKIKN